jgi:hypothetical protein
VDEPVSEAAVQQGVRHQLGGDEGDVCGERRVAPFGDQAGGAVAGERDAAGDWGVVEDILVEDGGGGDGGARVRARTGTSKCRRWVGDWVLTVVRRMAPVQQAWRQLAPQGDGGAVVARH